MIKKPRRDASHYESINASFEVVQSIHPRDVYTCARNVAAASVSDRDTSRYWFSPPWLASGFFPGWVLRKLLGPARRSFRKFYEIPYLPGSALLGSPTGARCRVHGSENCASGGGLTPGHQSDRPYISPSIPNPNVHKGCFPFLVKLGITRGRSKFLRRAGRIRRPSSRAGCTPCVTVTRRCGWGTWSPGCYTA